ncbi:hypothetical protein K435DRAFT_854235 [Dendrothele bispora CBS 962.96]|uniref:Uncharacterized protein n=1 Tax=Dendrothele bispora (strain CBS 962.96) TaxID=1314807 RepID=A0A4V4HH18_DENBC|nr:hypothetical protein K435DRAFT_854235 [Dendrothele bispora CBS 962.96]
MSDPEEVDKRRKMLGQLFLEVMNDAAKATNTRMHLMIVGEGETENKLFVSTVQAGDPMPGPNPKQFHEWDPAGFKMSHVRSFAEYVKGV